jgi:hypothetical protein
VGFIPLPGVLLSKGIAAASSKDCPEMGRLLALMGILKFINPRV